MPKSITILFHCTELKPALRLPVTGAATSLRAELVIEAPSDPPGGIVPIFALRGNNVGRRNRPSRPLLFSLTQGEQEQIKIEAEGDAMKGGFPLSSPGRHRIFVEWSAATGVTFVRNLNTGTVFSNGEPGKGGPVTGPITNGMLVVGGDMPSAGKAPDYIPPLGWSISGTVITDGDVAEQPADQGSLLPPPPREPDPPPPDLTPPPPTDPLPPPVLVPTPTPPQPPNDDTDDINWSALPQFIQALGSLYPRIPVARLQLIADAVAAGMSLADGDIDITDPADLMAILQLIGMFKRARGKGRV